MEKIDKKNLKILIIDVDGVLTDGGMYYFENGVEGKKFNTRDGVAIEIWRDSGRKTMIISGESCELIKNRTKKLKIDFTLLGIKDKLSAVKEILEKEKMGFEEIAFIGDEINDLQLLSKAGFSACPNDAYPEIKKTCNYICSKKGGEGVVREVVDFILS